jgi:hypothetical protein
MCGHERIRKRWIPTNLEWDDALGFYGAVVQRIRGALDQEKRRAAEAFVKTHGRIIDLGAPVEP